MLASIIIPCRNEVDYIDACLQSLLAQQLNNVELEIIVADGMSDDGTRERLARWQQQYANISLIDNLEHIVPTGLNRAIQSAKGEIIVRIDVHTEYAPDYIQQCVDTLLTTGAANVGGPWQASGKNYLQTAIAIAFQSKFSSGGAGSHDLNYEGEVDSVYLGCWKKQTLVEVGLFDEELVRNQDDELNLRLIRKGLRVWQSSRIKSQYFPRSSLKALFRQYMQYGYWKVRVIQKHKLPASIRHLVPGGFVVSNIFLLVLLPFSQIAQILFAAMWVFYLSASMLASIVACRKMHNMIYLPVMPLVFFIFHVGYGYGFVHGLFDFGVRNKGPGQNFTRLTRKKK